MGWSKVQATQKNIVKWCVRLASRTSKEHEKRLGKTDKQHRAARDLYCEKMKTAPDGVKYLEVKYLDVYKNGDAALLFQKMRWMSKYADPPLGDVWVMSIVFEQEGAIFEEPPGGSDQDYIDFLEMLNAPGGPIQTFLTDHGVSSLFSVGPVGATAPNRLREISWLEYVAINEWTPTNGTWSFETPIPVNATYVGDNNGMPISIDTDVLDFWKCGSARSFALTEMRFSP